MSADVELYGRLGFTHGWGRVLTVMCPAGADAVVHRIHAGDGVEVHAGEDRLPRYHEKRAGALDRLAEANKIRILGKAEWDAKKAELGEAIY